jgi:hypothetical protein
MNDEMYVKMLTKFFKGKINVEGVLFYPIGIYDANMGPDILKFRMENPKNLSYTQAGVESLLDEQVNYFNKLAGMGESSRFNVKVEDIEEIYVQDDIKSIVNGVLSKVTKLKTNFYEDEESNESVYDVILIDPEYVTYEMDDDFVRINNFVKPIKAYQYDKTTDELIKEITIEDAISGYEWWQSHHTYDETEINYPELDMIFSDREIGISIFIDADFQAPYVVTNFEM